MLVVSLRRPNILRILHSGIVLLFLGFSCPVAVLSFVLCVVGFVWVCACRVSYFVFLGLAFLGFRFLFVRVVRMSMLSALVVAFFWWGAIGGGLLRCNLPSYRPSI